MKKIILLFLFLVSCASADTILKLKDRRLIICKDKPGLCWPHKECTREKWYSPKKCVWKDGFQDMTNLKDRKTLRDMEFSCTSKMRFR